MITTFDVITILFTFGVIIAAYALGYRNGSREAIKTMKKALGVKDGHEIDGVSFRKLKP